MRLSVKKIIYENAKALETELKFLIAVGKVANDELLVVASDTKEKFDSFFKNTNRLLKRFKKQGIIQFFLYDKDLTDHSKTSSAYIANKYPEFRESVCSLENFFVIKI